MDQQLGDLSFDVTPDEVGMKVNIEGVRIHELRNLDFNDDLEAVGTFIDLPIVTALVTLTDLTVWVVCWWWTFLQNIS